MTEPEPRPSALRPAGPPGDAGLRSAVLRTAVGLVADAGGLRLGPEGLGLDTVIRAAGVPRTSVYRIWPNKETFHLDVLCALAAPDRRDAEAEDLLVARLREAVARNVGSLTTLDGRRALLRELCVAVAAHHAAQVDPSSTWRTGVALTASAVGGGAGSGEERERLAGQLRATERAALDRTAAVHADLAAVLGARLRDGLSHHQFALILSALGTGLALRSVALPDLVAGPVRLDATAWSAGTEVPLGTMLVIMIVERAWILEEDHDPGQALAAYLARVLGQPAGPASGPVLAD